MYLIGLPKFIPTFVRLATERIRSNETSREDGSCAVAPQPGLMWKIPASPGISAEIHGSDRGLQEGKVKENKYISRFFFLKKAFPVGPTQVPSENKNNNVDIYKLNTWPAFLKDSVTSKEPVDTASGLEEKRRGSGPSPGG